MITMDLTQDLQFIVIILKLKCKQQKYRLKYLLPCPGSSYSDLVILMAPCIKSQKYVEQWGLQYFCSNARQMLAE